MVIVFILLVALYPCAFGSCRFNRLSGVLKTNVSRSIEAHNSIACLRQGCMCSSRCAISFNPNTRACRIAALSAGPLAWTKDFLFDSSTDPSWSSFAPEASLKPTQRPTVLLTMNSALRGRNLGSKGSLLDSSDTGLVWTSEGPRTESSLKFARFNGSPRPVIQNRHDGTFLLDFMKPFTVGVWIKTDNIALDVPVMDGWNSDQSTYAFYFWLFPNKNLNQITINAVKNLRTAVNDTNKLNWRHIAFVQNGADNTVYLDGDIWPTAHVGENPQPRVNPDKITIGYRIAGGLSNHFFKGSMACLTFYQSALDRAGVRALKQNCP